MGAAKNREETGRTLDFGAGHLCSSSGEFTAIVHILCSLAVVQCGPVVAVSLLLGTEECSHVGTTGGEAC